MRQGLIQDLVDLLTTDAQTSVATGPTPEEQAAGAGTAIDMAGEAAMFESAMLDEQKRANKTLADIARSMDKLNNATA